VGATVVAVPFGVAAFAEKIKEKREIRVMMASIFECKIVTLGRIIMRG
jgi:hypothetical protein